MNEARDWSEAFVGGTGVCMSASGRRCHGWRMADGGGGQSAIERAGEPVFLAVVLVVQRTESEMSGRKRMLVSLVGDDGQMGKMKMVGNETKTAEEQKRERNRQGREGASGWAHRVR